MTERESSAIDLRMGKSAFVVLVVLLTACSTPPFVWVDQVSRGTAPTTNAFIREGDTVVVKVFGHEDLGTKDRVRADGFISVPVIGTVTARGKKPTDVATDIRDRMVKNEVLKVVPPVTVTTEASDLKVTVLGEVKNSGVYTLDQGANVLHALGAAGGLSDYAASDRIFVVRSAFKQRVRFRFQDLAAGDAVNVGFLLEPRDVVVVE